MENIEEVNKEPTVSIETPPQLTLDDLKLVAGTIDIAAKRGAFHAIEFVDVGTAFAKLMKFLEAAQEQEKSKLE